MSTHEQLVNLVNKKQNLIFPGMTFATLATGVELQRYLPVREMLNYQFSAYWAESGLKVVKPIVEEVAGRLIIDRSMAIEIARRIYHQRCVRYTNVNYVLSVNVMPSVAEANIPESDIIEAWSFVSDYLHNHKDEVLGGVYTPTMPNTSRMVGIIFDALEESRENYTTSRLNGMREVIRLIMHRLMWFVSASGKGTISTNPQDYDYTKAVMGTILDNPTHAEKAVEAFTGISESLTYNQFYEQVTSGAK